MSTITINTFLTNTVSREELVQAISCLLEATYARKSLMTKPVKSCILVNVDRYR